MPAQLLPIDKILVLLAEHPARIAAATIGLSEEQLRAEPGEGQWSASAILAHLRSCADMWGGGIAEIVRHDHPTIKAMNPRTWILQTDYLEQDFRPAFEAFEKQRQDLLALLQTLPPEGWQRTGLVVGAGKPIVRTVQFYADWLAAHERAHVKEIERLVKR